MGPVTRPGRLWLIRHAQASFGSANYDELSARGQQQAQRLASWLVAHPDLQFDHVTSGTLRRHAQTLSAIESAFAGGGRPLPATVQDADWNEFDHELVIHAYANAHLGEPIVEALRDGGHRAIHALLAAALHAWAGGELDGAVPETWNDFGIRVARARARLDAVSRGKVLVVSSGGPIARCAQAALGCNSARAVALNLALRNTAISEFRGAPDDWQMQIWNMLPHLSSPADREWVTYY